jgi:G:T-mismatch repair DNA endonuclease (very short patch repair protein)
MKTMRDLVLYELKLMSTAQRTGENTYDDFTQMDDEILFDAFCTYKFNEGWKHGNMYKFNPSSEETKVTLEKQMTMNIEESNKFKDAIKTLEQLGHHCIIMWTAEDVNTIKVNWSREECEEWLIEHADDIAYRMIEHGWEYIHDRLSQFDDRFYLQDNNDDIVVGHS